MSSLDADFNELVARMKHGREIGHAGFEPIYYLVFSPDQMLEVKRRTPSWEAKLRHEGWDVTTFSVAEHLWKSLEANPLWQLCLAQDARDPLNWARTNKSLSDMVGGGDALTARLEEVLRPLEGHDDALVLVTDLEALHPYLRIGAVESKLQGKFHVPTVFLYPGIRAGKVRLKFLGFYPEDGNYRSVHVGG